MIIFILVKKNIKKLSNKQKTKNIIQKVHSVSRNHKRLKNQIKKEDKNDKNESKVTIILKRRTSDINNNTKKVMNLSLNKLPSININKSLSNQCLLNKTYICLPALSLNNISFSKIRKKAKNKINISHITKNILL